MQMRWPCITGHYPDHISGKAMTAAVVSCMKRTAASVGTHLTPAYVIRPPRNTGHAQRSRDAYVANGCKCLLLCIFLHNDCKVDTAYATQLENPGRLLPAPIIAMHSNELPLAGFFAL